MTVLLPFNSGLPMPHSLCPTLKSPFIVGFTAGPLTAAYHEGESRSSVLGQGRRVTDLISTYWATIKDQKGRKEKKEKKERQHSLGGVAKPRLLYSHVLLGSLPYSICASICRRGIFTS